MNIIPAVYFSSLEIENIRCFGGRQQLDLTVNGLPAQWSLLIGENGAGKTTLLECLAWMRPVPELPDSPLDTPSTGEIPPLTVGKLTPALPEAPDDILETLPQDVSAQVQLSAKLEFGGVGFLRSTAIETGASAGSSIRVGMNLAFDQQGQLNNLHLTESTKITSLREPFHDPLIVAYGANRHLGERNLIRFDELDPLDYERLSMTTELCDLEELLLTLDYAARADNTKLESKVLSLVDRCNFQNSA